MSILDQPRGLPPVIHHHIGFINSWIAVQLSPFMFNIIMSCLTYCILHGPMLPHPPVLFQHVVWLGTPGERHQGRPRGQLLLSPRWVSSGAGCETAIRLRRRVEGMELTIEMAGV